MVRSEINRTRPCVYLVDHDKDFGFFSKHNGFPLESFKLECVTSRKSGLLQYLQHKV